VYAVEEGTGKAAAVEGYTVGGKTGTAQKYDPQLRTYSGHKYVASFVGFAPARDPRVVVLVMIDEPHGSIYGGSVAARCSKVVQRTALPQRPRTPDGLLVQAFPGRRMKPQTRRGDGARRARARGG
jgi:cell division protein FtsI (penicillin-binding protein 3)